MRHNFTPTTFNRFVSALPRTASVKTSIKGIEPPLKTGRGACVWIEDERADKCRRVVAMLFEDRRSIRNVLSQRHSEIVDLVKLGVGASQNGCVRCRSNRNLRIRPRENRRVSR